MFQVVSPKQWTAWVYLLSHSKRSVLNNGQLEFTFLSSKSVIPCFIRKQGVAQFFALISKLSFPILAEDGVSTISSPGMSDDETSLNFLFKCHSPFVGWRNVKDVIPSVSGLEMSSIKMSVFYKPSVQIHSKISQCLFKILFSFHLSSYYYQHGNGKSFSPVKLQYPLAESDPSSSTNLVIPSLFLNQIIFVIMHS